MFISTIIFALILSPGIFAISGLDDPFLSYNKLGNSQIYDIKQFSDGKLIILTANDPGFQIVLRNGTINTISNFRKLTNNAPTQIFPLSDDLMMIMLCTLGSPCENGTIIDLNGNVKIDNVQLGGVTTITTDNIPLVGFLGVSYTNNTIRWIKFRFPQNNIDRNLQIDSGTISARANYSINDVILFNNIDGSHAIVYSSYLNSVHRDLVYISDQSYFTTSICFYNEDTKIVNDPIQIYDSLQNNVNLTTFDCRSGYISNNSTSNLCIIGLKYSPPSNTTTNISGIIDLWLIPFSSLGTVFQSRSFVYYEIDKSASITIVPPYSLYTITSLPFGEFLAIDNDESIFAGDPQNPGHVFLYDVVNSTGFYDKTLPLNQTMVIDPALDFIKFGVMPNNTAWFFFNSTKNSPNWSLIIKNITKISYDANYENPNIISAEPARNTLNSTVFVPLQISSYFTLNITFSIQVIRSTGNISIYQSDNLRQTFPTNSKYCSTVNVNGNSTTSGSSTISGMMLSCTIFPSTFNRENQTYMIIADNNFVKSASNNEALAGIKKDIWMVSTSQIGVSYQPIESTTGTLRLTEDGTVYYNSLTSKNGFFEMLQKQLAECIPISNINLLVPTNRTTPDPISHNQLLVEFMINKAESTMVPDVKSIITDLNTIINNKDASSLAKQNLSIFLDSGYGFQQAPNLWNEMKFYLLGMGVACLIFAAIYLWSRIKHPEGNALAVFKVILIILDFILNILFILNDGHQFNDIFISRETHHNLHFCDWFTENTKVLAILTILSGADIEALNLFNSKFGGFNIFLAPLSVHAINLINYSSTLNLFIEDIPHLIIQ
ncbi:9811_t:CDS:2, partial [Dentiscutata erythropus]